MNPDSVKVSFAISHLRAAVAVLRQQGLTGEAEEVSRLADQIEAIQVQANDGTDDVQT